MTTDPLDVADTDTESLQRDARSVLLGLAGQVIAGVTFAQDPELIERLANVPVHTLLCAYLRLESGVPNAWSDAYRGFEAARKVVTAALDTYASDVELIDALTRIAERDESGALRCVTETLRLSREWSPTLAQHPSAGALTAALFDELSPTDTSARYVARALSALSPPGTDAQTELAAVLVRDWHGTLDSLVDTVREL